MPTSIPLLAIIVAAFMIGLVNALLSGQWHVPAGWMAAEQIVLYALGYWWFYLDKGQRAFRTGAIQNIGVLVVPMISVPIYLLRSRGAKGGLLGSVAFMAFLGAMLGAAAAGAGVARHVA